MNLERMRLVEEVFLAAQDARGAEREAILSARCGGDGALRAEVESLLAAQEDAADGFLDQPAIDPSLLAWRAPGGAADEPALPAGTRVGSYTITGVLGSGGMGLVYVAEQERPRRTVALKLIRWGLTSRSLLRRLEHEAELLGRLQHPGIAQIFEAGKADYGHGPQPYFAMELVRGSPLTHHADGRGLGTRERLELMLKVCGAVEHAHQKGVIHRDLKPGNILVDDAGQPKILDFGVARATDADLQRTTLHTGVGQLIGTLPYMSPEQVSGDPAEVDTRSDVYALGVVLYQLLTGRLPYEVGSRSIPEAARMIRDEQPTRLSSISKVFRGDIETIVAKALEKDRARRYQSSSELGADIARYLAGEPIAAKRDSAMYVARKQLNRYRGVAAGAALLVLGLVGFSIYAQLQAREYRTIADRESIERGRAEGALLVAERERQRAQDNAGRLDDLLIASNIERGRLAGITGNIALAEDLLWSELFRAPESTAVTWALRELYGRAPCLWTTTATRALTMAVSPSGRLLAIGGEARAVSIRDGATGQETMSIPALPAAVTALAFGAADDTVLIGLADGRVEVWSISGGARTGALGGATPIHAGGVAALAVSTSTGRIATAGHDKLVKLWDLATLEPVAAWPTLPVGVLCLAFSADGARIVTGGRDNPVRVWNSADGTLEREITGHTDIVLGVAFSPDGRFIASAGRDRAVLYTELAGGQSRLLSTSFLGWVRFVRFSPDGRRLAAAAAGGVRVWVVPEATESIALGMHPSWVQDGAWLPDGTLATVGRAGDVKRWEVQPVPSMKGLTGHEGWVFGIDHRRDGAVAATAGGDGSIRFWDTRSRTQTGRVDLAPNLRTRTVRFSPDGSLVAVASSDGITRLIDADEHTVIAEMGTRGPEAYFVAPSPDWSVIAVGYGDQVIRLWRTADRQMAGELRGLSTVPCSAAFTPDGSLLAAGGAGSAVQLWDVASRAVVENLEASGPVWSVAISPDGMRLAAGTEDGRADLWDLPSRRKIAVLEGHGAMVAGLAFGPGGALLATGGDDGLVKLWDAETGRALMTFESHHGEVPGLSFSPDGRTLAAACQGRFVCMWDLAYFDRHIAGNLEYQLGLRGPGAPAGLDGLRSWARQVLAR